MIEQEKLEKIISGIEHHMKGQCKGCSYDKGWYGCEAESANGLFADALALLKAQEPRLVTEADFENADAYGYLPVWVEEKDDSEIVCDCITKAALEDMDSGYHYRYWTSIPTQEQREATPWN